MVSFWFEERGTETYYSYALLPAKRKDSTFRETDWNTKIPHTKEEYENKNDSQRIYVDRNKTELQTVDELICKFMGEPVPVRERDSLYYYFIHDFGFSALYVLGGTYIEQKHVDWIIEKYNQWNKDHPTEYEEIRAAKVRALIRWVFLEKWIFGACG